MNIKKLLSFNEYLPIDNKINCPIPPQSYFNKVKDVYVTKGRTHDNVGVYCSGVSKDKLLIVVGESWTYGDRLFPCVVSIDNQDNLPYRISTIFAGKVANYLNSDLLLYAEPGESNINYWIKLEEILEFVSNEKYYNEIFLVIQMTSPGRDYNDKYVYDKIKHLFSVNKNNFPILSWEDWYIEYDKTYFNWLEDMIIKYKLKDVVLWKNFNEIYYKNKNLKFKIIDIPFQRYASEMSGISYISPKNVETRFYDNINMFYNLKTDLETLEIELERINIGFDALSKSMLNNCHPNEIGHWVLATLIREKLKIIYNI